MITKTILTALENAELNKGSFTAEDGKNKGEEINYSNIRAFCRESAGAICLLVLKNLSSSDIDSITMGDQFDVTLPLENVFEGKLGGKKCKIVTINFKMMENTEFKHIPKK